MSHKIFALIDPAQLAALVSLYGRKWEVPFGEHLDFLHARKQVPVPRQCTAPMHELVSVQIPVTESTWHWTDVWEQPDEQLGGAIEYLVGKFGTVSRPINPGSWL